MFDKAIADHQNLDSLRSAEIAIAALQGDTARLRKIAAQLVAEACNQNRSDVANSLKALLEKSPIELRPIQDPDRLPVDMKSRFPLLQKEEWPSHPLILDNELAEELEIAIEEISSCHLLEAQGLSSRNAVLLYGAPGTGKSLLAGHLAMRLGRPLLTIRLDTLISSLLGDTAKNIRSIFEYAIACKAVLFLDEIDAVAKKRDDNKELGELKRVVNALLQGLDLIDSDTVVVAATNHAHILDPAVWRRFPFQYEVKSPSIDMREALWNHYLYNDKPVEAVAHLATVSDGLTGSDIKEIAYAARKRSIISGKNIDVMAVLRAALESKPGEIVRPKFGAVSADVTAHTYYRLYREHRLSQAQIAQLAGVSRQSVSKILKSYENTK